MTAFAFGLRYDVLLPSSQFANSGIQITGTEPIQEITPGFTYYILGNQLKAILDLPLLINTPVFTEPKVGQYVGPSSRTRPPCSPPPRVARSGGRSCLRGASCSRVSSRPP